MLAYGTETFTVKDFIKTGVPVTVIGYILIVIMSMTYWKWMEYFKIKSISLN